MTIEGKLFPGQENEERIFLLIRKHWFNYVIFVILVILMLVPVAAFIIYVTFFNPDFIASEIAFTSSVLIISAYLLSIMALQLYGIVDYYLDVYIVTDQRIVDISQKGFFKRQISELHLRQVQDVNAKVEGFFRTVLHFGDVYIQTAGEQENFVFQSIPHPYTVAKEIINLHERHLEESSNSSPSADGGVGNIIDGENSAGKGLPLNNNAYRQVNNTNPVDLSAVTNPKNSEINTVINASDSPQSGSETLSDQSFQGVINNSQTNLNGELREGSEVNLEK